MNRFSLPLLDRLIDTEPRRPVEPLRPMLTLDQLKDVVARDVEVLLNARRGSKPAVFDGYPNARASVVAFGLDDFVSLSIASGVDREAICRGIERAIMHHEPRLHSIQVELDRRDAQSQKLCFSIKAVLIAHPTHEPVNFDAVLQTTTQSYAVQTARRV